MVKATDISLRKTTVIHTALLRDEHHSPPSSCSYSKKGDGFLRWHGVAVKCKKYGFVNLHRFIAKRHLIEAWRKQYEDVEFKVP